MKIAYDTVLKRPGCVLLQASMGGDTHLAQLFETKYWLVFPTDNLQVYEVTEEQLEKLVRITERHAAGADA